MKKAVQIQYWSGIYTDRSLKDVLTTAQKEALAKCFKRTKSTRFHKLKGYPNIFAIKYNEEGHDEGRLLLTIKDGKLIVIADLPDHNYKPKLKSLKKLLNFFNNNDVILKSDSSSDDDDSTEDPATDFEALNEAPVYDCDTSNNNNDDDDGDDPEIDYQPVAFEGSSIKPNVLVLDEDQLNVIEIAMPAIVSGPPGSGKTTVARTLLTQVGRLGAGEKILYLTRSNDLVEQIKAELENITTDEIKAKINIKTYNDFLTNPNDNNAKKVLEPEKITKAVKEWLQVYFKNTKNKNKLTDSFKNDEDILVQEFRIRSGFSEKEYCDVTKVGAKQSLYHKAEQRVWVNEAYKAFMADLATQDFLIADYAQIPAATQKCHTVIVDEAQDLSNLQLASIKTRLAKSNRLCFFYGDGQSLEDDVPSKIFIKGLFAAPLTVQTASLTQHYRCTKEAMFVAGEVNKVRIKLTPKNKMEEPLKLNNHKSGGVKWVGKGCSDKELEALRKLVAIGKAEVCIVAHPDKLEEAEKFFGAKPWQVRTPERVKGLQYQTIIIYEPFTDPKFKAIDAALEEEKIEDSSFSSPLSQLFVSITRAEKDVIFYSTIHRKNLEQRIKKAIADTNSEVKMSAEKASVADLETRAASLMRNREKDNAEAILKEELHYDEAAIAAFMKRHHLVLPTDNVGRAVSSHELNNAKKASASKKNQRKASDNKAAPVVVSATKKVDEYVGCTKLFIAVRKNELAEVREILKGGVDVNEAQGVGFWEGDTALDAAASYGHIEIAEALIEAGANIKVLKSRVVEDDGKVSYSTVHCTEQVSELLRRAQACEQVAIAVLKKTTMKGTSEAPIIEELNNNFSLGSDMADPRGRKLFHRTRWALFDKENPVKAINLIKDYLVNSDLVARIGLHEGYTLLDIAVLIEHLEAVEILLEQGASVKNLKARSTRPQVSAALSRMEKCENLAKVMIKKEIVKCVKTMQSSDPADAEKNHNHLIMVMIKLNEMFENTNEISISSMRKLLNDVRRRLYKSESTNVITKIIETAIFEYKMAHCDVKSQELIVEIIKSSKDLERNLQGKSLLVDKLKERIAAAFYADMKLADIKNLAQYSLMAISRDEGNVDALFVACNYGDLEEVNRLIKEGVNVNHIYGEFNESSALHEAARRGHSAIVGSLIAAGAHAHLLMGSLALLAAVRGYADCEEQSNTARKYSEVIMQLLSAGAETVLLKNAKQQYESIFESKVLEILGHIDDCTNSTKKIINKHVSAMSNIDRTKLALNSQRTMQLHHSINALHFALLTEHDIELAVTDGLKEILSNSDNTLPVVPSDEMSQLFKAAWQGQLQKVRTLLGEDVDVNIVEKGLYQGFTPLYAAARKEVSSIDIVNELLRAGANVELLPGRTLVDGKPVYSDLYKEDIIKILQSAERCERLTFSMIESAIKSDKLSVNDREFLLNSSILELIKQKSRGLMFRATPKDRETILLYVAQKIQAAIDEALLAKDAVKAVRTSSPSLLTQYLMEGATTSTSSTSSTVDAKVSLNDQFYEACTKGDKTLVESLLGQGANVNYIKRDPNNGLANSAMFDAVSRGHTEIVKLLIGAGVNLQAKEGGHVLFAAVNGLIKCTERNWSTHQHTKTLEMLVSNGANTHGLRDKNAKKVSYSKTMYTQKMIAMFEKIDRAEHSATKHIAQYTAKLTREQKACLAERSDLSNKLKQKVTGLFFVDQELFLIKKFMSDTITEILLPQPSAPSMLTQYGLTTSATSGASTASRAHDLTNALSVFDPRSFNAPR